MFLPVAFRGVALFTVHGLWSAHQELCLWLEDGAATAPDAATPTPNGAPAPSTPNGTPASPPQKATPAAPPPGTGAPASLAALASDMPLLAQALARPLGRALTVREELPAPLGGAALPVRRLFPARALPVLLEIAAATSSDPAPGPRPGVDIVPGPDLVFWARLAADLERLVAAGRLTPTLTQVDGQWWARWQVLADATTGPWLAALTRALPPIALGEQGEVRDARDVVDSFCGEFTDLLARRRQGEPALGLAPERVRSPLLSWLTALDTGEPVTSWPDTVLQELAGRIERWRASAYTAPYELLLRVVEPAEDAPSESWSLQLRLRSLADPSLVLSAAEVRARSEMSLDPAALILSEVGRASVFHPALLDIVRGAEGFDIPVDIDTLVRFVAEGAGRLAEAGFAVQLPAHWSAPALGLRLHARAVEPDGAGPSERAPRLGMDQLVDYSWRVALGDAELTEAELRSLAEAKAPLVRLRGQWVQVDPETIERTLRFLQRGTEQRTLGDLMGRLAGARPLPVPVQAVQAEGWLGDLLSGRAAAHLEEVPAPEGLHALLRPYQSRGLAWLSFMSRLGLGVILADDMGLGKTVQLLALLAAEREADAVGSPTRSGAAAVTSPSGTAGHPLPPGALALPAPPGAAALRRPGRAVGPTLVVCPMSVVGNWQREAARFTPDLRVYVHHGPGRATGQTLRAVVAACDLVITTYGLLARDVEDLAASEWARVALDEAQHVKNSSTRQARAARALPAAHRVALSGTPVENRLEELRSLLDFVNPGLLGSAQSFRKRFAVPIERDADAEAAARLRLVTSPFVLRRVKTDPAVISDLPDKLEMTVRANLTAEQASLYQAEVDEMMRRIEQAGDGIGRKGLVLATLTRLKQICNHPAHFLGDGSPVERRGVNRSGKLALVADILDTVLADGEKVLCFTQFREFGAMLAPWLAARFEVPVPFLHGGVSRARRETMVEEFQSDDGPPILLASLKAGGTGLNLTAASQVVHLDRWWNPAVEDQATDRAYRIGQTRTVQVRKLVCVGTLEERIDAMITDKRALADMVVGTGEAWLTELDTDRLRELVRLSVDAIGE